MILARCDFNPFETCQRARDRRLVNLSRRNGQCPHGHGRRLCKRETCERPLRLGTLERGTVCRSALSSLATANDRQAHRRFELSGCNNDARSTMRAIYNGTRGRTHCRGMHSEKSTLESANSERLYKQNWQAGYQNTRNGIRIDRCVLVWKSEKRIRFSGPFR